VGRLSFTLLIVAGLLLTAYFGAAAWRQSDDRDIDITGRIPAEVDGWKPALAR
jgi:hypothetical protein